MALVRDDYSNAETFLAAHPTVRVVDVWLPDLCGVLRGKRIDRSDLPAIYQRGLLLPGSMFALDVLGGTVQATGLGFDDGDADRACQDSVFTYQQLNSQVNRVSHLFLEMGVQKGDRVAVLLYNSNVYIEIYFALAKIGAVLVPLNFRLSRRELEFVLKDSGAETLIFGPEFAETINSIKSNLPVKKANYVCYKGLSDGPVPSWATDCEGALEGKPDSEPTSEPPAEREDPHIIMYTSSTTGVPKGAVLSHRKTFFNVLNADIYFGLTPEDILLITRPLFHSGGLLVGTSPMLYKGGTVVFKRRFKPAEVLEAIEKYRVSVMELPAIFNSTAGASLGVTDEQTARLQHRVDRLIRAYRVRGHRAAEIDPLNIDRPQMPVLDPAYYGFSDADMDRQFVCETMKRNGTLSLREILQRLRDTYCRSIGVQFMHIDNLQMRHWLQERIEGSYNRTTLSRETQLRILTRLTDAVVFEEFIRKKFIGAKSFSLEGAESLIPLLDLAIEKAGEQGIQEIVMAMAHRGRLNVLANIIGKNPREIFREFQDEGPDLMIREIALESERTGTRSPARAVGEDAEAPSRT